jgi:hypothetical protein
MRPLNKGFLYTATCAFVLSLPTSVPAQSAEQAVPRDPQMVAAKQGRPAFSVVIPSSSSVTEQIAASELPDSPGAAWSKAQDPSSQQSSSSSRAVPPSGQAETRQTTAAENQNQDPGQKTQRPVGTAAAEAPKTKGVTAAQPSGIAIAPAKQRRVRTIVLRVGAMVAAGAAVGTVIALTEGTPSRPPGAH